MSVLVVADPLGSLDPAVDATLGLVAAAQELGVEVLVCTPEDLAVVDGRVLARVAGLTLGPRTRAGDHRWRVEPSWYELTGTRVVDVAATVELVLLRIDPPVDARYLHTTYVLDLVEGAGVRVTNSPAGIRQLHEKLIALRFPELCPRTTVGTDVRALRSFVAESGAAVVKPVDGFAGRDVWLVHDGPAATALLESATAGGTRQVIAQEYLSSVTAGNKRLFLLEGEIVGAVLRRPADDDFRIGPPCAVAEIDDADRRIVAALAPVLDQQGIALAGLDVIAGRLIEVNVTCPGGMAKADALVGTDLSGVILRQLLHHHNTLPKVQVLS